MRGLTFFGLFGSVIALSLFSGCADYGDKITRLRGEVFFTEGITQSEAEELADWLVDVGYFDTLTQKSVQIERTNDTCHIRFVIRKDFREESDVERFMILAAYELSRMINAGKPTVAYICNDRFETQKDVPLNIVRKGGEVIFTERVKASDAGSLAEFLYETAFFNDSTVTTVLLDRDLDRFLFKFVAKPGVADDPAYAEEAAIYAQSISRDVFDGTPVDFYFVDGAPNTERVVYFAGR